ncbi:MAG TPA: phage holin family protein [Candidatus Acidoferrum sp.]|nr:phage holin family protein [Candidatus Acidoferrum sp.]
MEGPDEKRRGIFASLNRLVRIVVATATNRVELLLLEWNEERLHLVATVLLVGVLLILALMTLMTATLIVVAYCVKNDHLGIVIGLNVFYLVVTIGCYWLLRRQLRSWKPFAATLAELKKDKECWEAKT